jgi:hypothetical protein
MHCPRCNQPVHTRSHRHRDGHVDTWHVCRNHLCRWRSSERRDASDAQVRVMRRTDPWAEAPDHKVVTAFDPSDFPGGRYLTAAECCEVLRERGWEIADGTAAALPPAKWLAVGASDGKVGIVREPEVLGHTTGGDVVLGVPRKQNEPPAVLRTVEDIATFLLKTTGIPWDVRRSDERFHVQPLSGALSSVGVVDAVEKLLARVPIFYVVDWGLYAPNVAKVETPNGWQDGVAPPITWQAIVDTPVLARQSKHNEPPAGSDLVLGVPKSRPNPMPRIGHILDMSAHDISLAGVYVGPGDGLHIHLRGEYYEGQSLLCQCGMGGRQQVNIVQISPQSDGTVMARFRVKCLGCDTTQYSYNAVSVTELPKVGASAPKPPRPVKVGDVLLNEVGQSARKVLGVERGRLLLCYCGHGVDESVATASYLLDDALRLGWTHADGAAIAVETKHREVMPGDVLRDYDGEGWRVDAFDGERYRLQSTGRPIDCLITLDGMRAEGWTFADTGEKV